jgi:hypothetical protein
VHAPSPARLVGEQRQCRRTLSVQADRLRAEPVLSSFGRGIATWKSPWFPETSESSFLLQACGDQRWPLAIFIASGRRRRRNMLITPKSGPTAKIENAYRQVTMLTNFGISSIEIVVSRKPTQV